MFRMLMVAIVAAATLLVAAPNAEAGRNRHRNVQVVRVNGFGFRQNNVVFANGFGFGPTFVPVQPNVFIPNAVPFGFQINGGFCH